MRNNPVRKFPRERNGIGAAPRRNPVFTITSHDMGKSFFYLDLVFDQADENPASIKSFTYTLFIIFRIGLEFMFYRK